MRTLAVATWLLSVVVAIGFPFVAGYYAWAAVVVWTLLVLPGTIHLRRLSNGHWPSRTLVQLWGIALVFNILGGLAPIFLSAVRLTGALATTVEWILLAFVWGGLVAAMILVVSVTFTALRHSADAPKGAA